MVDKFVVQLISDPEKKKECCKATWGVLLECAINLGLFSAVVKSSHSHVAPREHSSRCFPGHFLAQFPTGGLGARLMNSPGRGTNVKQILQKSSKTATRLMHVWGSDKVSTFFLARKVFFFISMLNTYLFLLYSFIAVKDTSGSSGCAFSFPPPFETILDYRKCWFVGCVLQFLKQTNQHLGDDFKIWLEAKQSFSWQNLFCCTLIFWHLLDAPAEHLQGSGQVEDSNPQNTRLLEQFRS